MTEPLETFIAYTNDFYAVERTLRFFQGTFGILATLTSSTTSAAHSNLAKENVHLARRFFRAFKWVDFFVEIFSEPKIDYGGLHESVRMLRNSALSMYFFLDMLVLPSEVGYADPMWLGAFVEEMTGFPGLGNEPIANTAMFCWFWAIFLSVVLGFLELAHSPPKETKVTEKTPKSPKGRAITKKGSTAKSTGKYKSTSTVVQELICNSLDIIIPGTAVGYFKFEPIYISVAMATSSLITMNSTWNRIYAEKEAAL